MIGRRIALGAALFGGLLWAATAAQAAEGDCQALTIEGGYIVARTGDSDLIRTGLVGPNLWVQLGVYEGGGEYEGTVSHEVGPDGTATVCVDGSVAFEAAEVVDEAPVEVVADTEPTPSAELIPVTSTAFILTGAWAGNA